MANANIVARAAFFSSVATAAWCIIDHGTVFTALVRSCIDVPELMILTALFLVATFLGVWVMAGAISLSLLGVREGGSIIVAVAPAVEFIILTTPIVAVKDLSITSGVVVGRIRVWVVVSVATYQTMVVAAITF